MDHGRTLSRRRGWVGLTLWQSATFHSVSRETLGQVVQYIFPMYCILPEGIVGASGTNSEHSRVSTHDCPHLICLDLAGPGRLLDRQAAQVESAANSFQLTSRGRSETVRGRLLPASDRGGPGKDKRPQFPRLTRGFRYRGMALEGRPVLQ